MKRSSSFIVLFVLTVTFSLILASVLVSLFAMPSTHVSLAAAKPSGKVTKGGSGDTGSSDQQKVKSEGIDHVPYSAPQDHNLPSSCSGCCDGANVRNPPLVTITPKPERRGGTQGSTLTGSTTTNTVTEGQAALVTPEQAVPTSANFTVNTHARDIVAAWKCGVAIQHYIKAAATSSPSSPLELQGALQAIKGQIDNNFMCPKETALGSASTCDGYMALTKALCTDNHLHFLLAMTHL
jgi:hypothetical protein